MTTNHAIKFFAIAKLFKNDEKQLRRGENAYTSGHVKKMFFHREVQPAIIKGSVQASMKKRTYTVEVSIDLKEQVVISNSCTCPRGQVVCHHLAALLYYAHYNISSTDIQRQWGTTAANLNAEVPVHTIEELYDCKQQYVAVCNKITTSEIEDFRQILGQTNVGFSWLLKPEANEAVHKLVPSIDDIVFSEEYFQAEHKEAYFLEKCFMPAEKIQEIASLTVGQHMNENWLITRKSRLTASKFGLVLKACKRNKYPPSLLKALLEGYSMDRVLAVQWGKDNEQTAIQKFMEETNFSVIATGLCLHECGFMGASPDGLVGEDSIIEVKCPYKFRNISINEGVKNKNYLFHYENGEILIDRDHNYYHQIQGQLYITKRKQCYFFVWTPIECECVIIERDEDWLANIDILKNFYLKHFLSTLLK
ncbi:uncharacterized protein LOC108912481 [Anoplophora glabripennis]|nr:uncharacterized protein LOC108912481 [Anoplophora glabripennis]